MRTFSILGTFVDQDIERESQEDLTPQTFKMFIAGLEDKEELELHINSCGGSVTSGISVANCIRDLISKGHKVTCVIDGLAASIASVVACACSEIKMHKSSCMMIHNAWGVVQGNSEELRKQADIMEKMNVAIMSFYTSKFTISEEEIKHLMDLETWIFGSEAEAYGLKTIIINDENEYKIAAKLRKMNFKNLPKGLIMEDNKETKEEVKTQDTDQEELKEQVEKQLEEQKKEEPKEEPKEEKKEEAPKAEVKMIAMDECEKRVQGMQSTMAKQMDTLKKDFENQIKARDEELTKFKAEVTSLKGELEKAAKELEEKKANISDLTSALDAKKQALATLNANVNTPTEELPTMEAGLAKCKTSAERVAFLKSGKYTK